MAPKSAIVALRRTRVASMRSPVGSVGRRPAADGLHTTAVRDLVRDFDPSMREKDVMRT
jgi:hypothetical protein